MWKEKVQTPKFRKTSKDLPWVNRNPRIFIILTTAFALSIFFSKPAYDLMYAKRVPHPSLSRMLGKDSETK